MKVYYHFNIEGFSNTYLVVNESSNEAVIIDPGEITEKIISQIEEKNLNLIGILITHNHKAHIEGINTLLKIYSPKVFAADWEVSQNNTTVISGDGKFKIGQINVHYLSIPGHTSDSVAYGIGNLLFTGDILFAGTIGSTNSSYSEFILRSNINNKILSQQDEIVLMPGHGPPTTIEAEKNFNRDLS
ncbi:MAG: MBL fold metallo-hydrolase [Treponema sp.]|nr:MBL fold metallo-hydrolase [Treponema sp.]